MATLSLGRGENGELVLFSSDQGRPVEGRLPAEALATVAARVHALLRPAPGLALPSDDLRWAGKEAEAGALLADLLACPTLQAVSSAMARWRGRREAAGAQAWLGIDCEEPALARLPWELLESADAASGPAAGCCIARVVPGRPPLPLSASRAVRLLCPTPQDPVCATALGLAAASAQAAGLRVRYPGEPAPPPGPSQVVHVVAHGVVDAAHPGVGLASGAVLSAEAARQLLDPALASAALVVLDVCHGAGEALAVPGLARRLAAAGALVLAPTEPLDVHAAGQLHAGLYAALGAGAEPRVALAAARRRLRGAAGTSRAARWWVPAIVVSVDPEALPVAGAPAPAPRRSLWPAVLAATLVALAAIALRPSGTAVPPPPAAPVVVTPAPEAPAASTAVATVDAPPPPPRAAPVARPTAPPEAPGQLEVRPLSTARVRTGGGAWVQASRVMPLRLEVAAGAQVVDVEGPSGTFTCTAEVQPGATARVCPEPSLGSCRCP